ncbi:MAG: endolytic transglycosylase MltG [Anaerolineae bacterium]|nr:endolytic transglycosylase MltG [Anaerolineae bacterium]
MADPEGVGIIIGTPPAAEAMTAVPRGRFARLLTLTLLLVVGACAWGWHAFMVRPLEFASSPVRYTVPKGASVRAVAAGLRALGVGVSPTQLWLWYKLRRYDGRLKAGTYGLAAPLTVDALLDKLVRGDVLLTEIRFIEGWTFRQMRDAVDAHPDLAHDTRGLAEATLLGLVGAQESRAEGLFFPDTYAFSPGVSDVEIYRQAYRRQQLALRAAWEARDPSLPYATPYEALVLASIVEKETGRAADRDKIAAVFVNRLRRGMMLQSDPTTIYGMGERFDGNLRKRDLQADSAYNTYTRAGLPPTPIALPGKASIEAALAPANVSALYFVARGDGTSEFSDDLSSHNRAVSRYQRNGR